MSLKMLLTLMALISVAMMAAVIQQKVFRPGARYDPSVAELQTLKRVCEAQCERDAPRVVSIAKDAADVARMANECMLACVKRAISPPSTAAR